MLVNVQNSYSVVFWHEIVCKLAKVTVMFTSSHFRSHDTDEK